MVQKKIVGAEVKTVYIDLLDGSGYYCHRPGKAPFICLDNFLLEGSEASHQDVYRVLLDYHHSIPLDSIFRSFVMVKYYEDLIPPPVIKEPEKVAVTDAFIVGRVIRKWDFTYYEFGIYANEDTHIVG